MTIPSKFTIFTTCYFERHLSKITKAIFPNTYYGVEIISDSLLIQCNDRASFKKVVRHLPSFVDLAKRIGFFHVKIFQTFSESVLHLPISTMTTNNLKESQSYLEYVFQGDCSRSLSKDGIILVSSSVVLAQNGKNKVVKSPNVLGLDARRFWTEDEWERKDEFLQRDKKLVGYEYKGFSVIDIMNPNPEAPPKLFDLCADFELINFCGQECVIGSFSYA